MKPQEVILVGAGGHALSIAEFAGKNISGYISNEPNPDMPGKWFGTDAVAEKLAKEGKLFHVAFVYSGLPVMSNRKKIIENYQSLNVHFETLVAPSAIISPNSRIGVGSVIMSGAIVNRAILGENVIVNSGAIVEHDCKVGNNSFIGPGAVVGGFTSIGENCFIGLGVKIGNGLTIGDNVSVAMGAVVNKDLLEPGIYHGFPLKRFKIDKL